jgi:hypothetical protein
VSINRRWLLYQVLSAALITLGVMGGLFLIQGGAEKLFEPTGEDRAIPGDEVGELEIVSTRQVAIHWERVIQMLLGFGLVGMSLYGVRWLKTYLVCVKDMQQLRSKFREDSGQWVG